MALIKCPECGKQISDKAITCPHCGIDVKSVFDKIREEKEQQRKKRRKRAVATIISVVIMTAIAVVAYLYHIDGLNTIPAEYREETVEYFDKCESAINKDDFADVDKYLNRLKDRTFTKRQAKRFERIQKEVNELALNKAEQQLVDLETKYSKKGILQFKKYIYFINTNLIDSLQTESLTNVKEKYVEIEFRELEKEFDLYKSAKKSNYLELVAKANELQIMELSDAQSARVEEIIAEAEKIKKRKAEKRYLTQDLRMYGLYGPVKSFKTTVSRIDGPSRWEYFDEKEMYDLYFSQSIQFDNKGHFVNTIDGGFTIKEISKKDGDKILEVKRYIDYFGIYVSLQWNYYPNGSVKQRILEGYENHETCQYFYNEAGELLKTETFSAAEGTNLKTITTYSIEKRDRYGNWTKQIAEVTEYEYSWNEKDYVQSAFRHEMYNRVISYY